MSLEQIESKLMELPAADRREFVRWFYHHENKILHDVPDEKESPEVQAEITRRLEELRANPSLAIPVNDEWFDQLKRKLSIARTPIE